MSASDHRDGASDFGAILNMSSAQLYRLVESTDSAAIEDLIARLFREFFLECPDRSADLIGLLTEMTTDPMLRSMAYAPDDEEPLTDDDITAIDEALDEVEQDKVIPHEQLA